MSEEVMRQSPHLLWQGRGEHQSLFPPRLRTFLSILSALLEQENFTGKVARSDKVRVRVKTDVKASEKMERHSAKKRVVKEAAKKQYF